MWVCVTFCINTRGRVANILKKHKYRIFHLQSIGIKNVILLFDLDLYLEGPFCSLLDLRVSRKLWNRDQALLLSWNRKSFLGFRLHIYILFWHKNYSKCLVRVTHISIVTDSANITIVNIQKVVYRLSITFHLTSHLVNGGKP